MSCAKCEKVEEVLADHFGDKRPGPLMDGIDKLRKRLSRYVSLPENDLPDERLAADIPNEGKIGTQREFTRAVFTGNDRSGWRINYLHRLLEAATEELCGLQQPIMSTMKCDPEEHDAFLKESQQQLNSIVANIAMALTGQEWAPLVPVHKRT